MPQQVPLLANNPSYSFTTTLAGVNFEVDVRWNSREEAWYFDVLDEERTRIYSSLKMALGTVLGNISASGRPAGVFLMSDLTGEDREATFDDINSRVVLLFFSDAELEG